MRGTRAPSSLVIRGPSAPRERRPKRGSSVVGFRKELPSYSDLGLQSVQRTHFTPKSSLPVPVHTPSAGLLGVGF